MNRRSLMVAALVLAPAIALARRPYIDFLPNLPAKPPQPPEPVDKFLSQCRDEEAYIFTKYTKLHYSAALFKATQGDIEALKKIFSVAPYQDGAGAEGYADTIFWLLQHVGDDIFSSALATRSRLVRQRVIGLLDFAASFDYSASNPKTFKLGVHHPQ